MYEEFGVIHKEGSLETLTYRLRDSGLPDGWYLSFNGRELHLRPRNISNLISGVIPEDRDRLRGLPDRLDSASSWNGFKPPRKRDDGNFVLSPSEEVSVHEELKNELRYEVRILLDAGGE